MENVGQSKIRNQKYYEKFNRDIVIRNIVGKEDPICFDIGAHEGESVEYFKKIFKNPFIYSFEPSPKSFETLKSKNYDNNLCFNYAISNITGDAIFYENEINHTSSLYRVNTSSRDSIKIQEAIKSGDKSIFDSFNSEITVKAIKLDDFLLDEKISQIDLLKIDVQGAESLVLEGSANILEKTYVLLLEISFYDYYEKKSCFLDVEKFLIPKGFELFTISEISYNPMNGRTDWVEAIYIKDC